MTLETLRWQDRKEQQRMREEPEQQPAFPRQREYLAAPDLTLEEIIKYPRDQELVLEGLRMQQALEYIEKVTYPYDKEAMLKVNHAQQNARRLRLIPGMPTWDRNSAEFSLGYAMGRTWVAEL